jgi:hypothetical protein
MSQENWTARKLIEFRLGQLSTLERMGVDPRNLTKLSQFVQDAVDEKVERSKTDEAQEPIIERSA